MKPDRPILTIDGTKDGMFYSLKLFININQLLEISLQVLSGDQVTVSSNLKQPQKHPKKPAVAGFFVFRAVSSYPHSISCIVRAFHGA